MQKFGTVSPVPPPSESITFRSQEPEASILPGLDGIRGLACLWVFLHHLFIRFDFGNSPLIRLFTEKGPAGVAVFLILSGFLLAGPYWDCVMASKSFPSFGTYVKKRFARIWPAFALCVLILSVLMLHEPGTFSRMVSGLAFLNWISPAMFFISKWNLPLWSVPMEWLCYLALPPLMWVFKVIRMRAPSALASPLIFAVGILVISISVGLQKLVMANHAPLPNDGTYSAFERFNWEWHASHGPLAMLPFFFLGLAFRNPSMMRMVTQRANIMGLAAVAGILLSLYPNVLNLFTAGMVENLYHLLFVSVIPYPFPWFGLAVALFITACSGSRLLSAWLDAAPLKFFGRISYGVYLWHFPILLGLDRILARMDLSESMRFVLLGVVGLSASMALGQASWRYLEAPFIRFARKG